MLSIDASAFEECSVLTDVTLPKSLTAIGDSAFEGCVDLSSVVLPEGVTSIADWAFAGCSALSSVTVPASVTSIGFDAFGEFPLLSLTVESGSYAEQYAIENEIPYVYPGQNPTPAAAEGETAAE